MLPDPEGRWIRMRNLPQPRDARNDPPKDCALVVCYKKGMEPWIGYYFAAKPEWRGVRVSEYVDRYTAMTCDIPDYWSEIIVWDDPLKQREFEILWSVFKSPV